MKSIIVTDVMTPRREHSRKPEIVREMRTTLLGELDGLVLAA